MEIRMSLTCIKRHSNGHSTLPRGTFDIKYKGMMNSQWNNLITPVEVVFNQCHYGPIIPSFQFLHRNRVKGLPKV